MKRRAIILVIVAVMLTTCFAIPTMGYAADGTEVKTTENLKAPTNLRVTPTDYNTVKVTWSGVVGADYYKVYYSSNKTTWKLKSTTKATSTSFDVRTGAKRYYKVVSHRSSSNMATATGVSNSATSQMVSATAVLSKSAISSAYPTSRFSVKLTWSKVTGANGYGIFRYSRTKKSYVLIKSFTNGSSTTTYTHTSRTPGVSNSYRVRAFSYNTDKTRIYATSSATKVVTTPVKWTTSTPGYKYSNVYRMMKIANSKVGCRYVSGAEGPSAFDCSGLAYYVVRNSKASSKKMYRTTAQGEYNQLKRYDIGRSYSRAQAGDLVFYSYGGRKTGISHVAIYAGSGQVVHALNPGQGVKKTPASWGGTVAAIVRMPGL